MPTHDNILKSQYPIVQLGADDSKRNHFLITVIVNMINFWNLKYHLNKGYTLVT